MSEMADRPRRDRFWLLTVLVAICLAILLSLGTWQVRRLAWKEALIAEVEARLPAAPRPILDVVNEQAAAGNLDYWPVTVSGTFLPDAAFFEFTTHEAMSGWNQFAILALDPGLVRGDIRYIAVNRGFIPIDRRDGWPALAPLPQGVQTVTGLLRVPPASKPGSFMPDNEPDKGTYFWRDLKTMAKSAGIDPDALAPWYVDRGIPGQPSKPGEYPVPGTTIVAFTNNHLQYAVTWYGLAAALAGVFGVWAWRRFRP